MTIPTNPAVNDVAELKQFAELHARAQAIPGYRALLDRIDNDQEGRDGSWAVEWSREADALLAQGKAQDACRHYAMARFPYPDGPTRERAANACIAAFDQWRREKAPKVERLEVETSVGTLRCWAVGLSAAKPRPLLLIMGGIVSVKEQWASVLPLVDQFGMAGIAAELPGVGENGLPYDAGAWRMIPALLDALADRADVARTYANTLSFSGHLALRAAAEDPRIRGVVTAGAPVRAFFTDPAWAARIPRITADTLARLTGGGPEDQAGRLAPLALTDPQLDAVRIPVAYLHSRRDEIIPGADVDLLHARLADLRLVENDDVHGSPRHVTESRVWAVLSVLRMRHVHSPQRVILSAVWRVLRARRFFRGAPK